MIESLKSINKEHDIWLNHVNEPCDMIYLEPNDKWTNYRKKYKNEHKKCYWLTLQMNDVILIITCVMYSFIVHDTDYVYVVYSNVPIDSYVIASYHWAHFVTHVYIT